MKKIKIVKAAVICILFLFLSVFMLISVLIKDRTVKEMYEDVLLTQISTEARQYLNNIEYSVKYGRELNCFYEMDNTLNAISQCSSYIDGAYIVSAEKQLLYQTGVRAVPGALKIPHDFKAGKTYSMYQSDGWYYVVMPIRNGNIISGYLYLRIGEDAVANIIADSKQQNIIQSVLIGSEIAGLALLFIMRARLLVKDRPILHLVKLASFFLILALILDSGVTVARYYQIANDISAQTVDKIAQSLQSDVDSIKSKGISSGQLYDLNGWLDKNKSQMPIVASLYIDKNEKITATVSQTYVNGFMEQSVFRLSLLLAGCLLLCFMIYIPCCLYNKRKDKSKV